MVEHDNQSVDVSLSLSVFSQFSDNGLVHFQSVTENEQHLLPAPFASGFPRDMNVSLLAVFWDDVDLTHAAGRLLYQVRCRRACSGWLESKTMAQFLSDSKLPHNT